MGFRIIGTGLLTIALFSIIGLFIFTSLPVEVFATETHEVGILRGATTLGEKAYSPNPIQISKGDTIRFVNMDNVLHSATSGDGSTGMTSGTFDSGLLGPNRSAEIVINEAGDIPYFCVAHPTMVGLVKVSEDSAGNDDNDQLTIETMYDGKTYSVTSASTGSAKATNVTINPGVSVLVTLDHSGEVELRLPVEMIEGISSVTTVYGTPVVFTKVDETESYTTIKFAVPDGQEPSVIIMGARVVPEFSSALVFAAGSMTTALVVLLRVCGTRKCFGAGS